MECDSGTKGLEAFTSKGFGKKQDVVKELNKEIIRSRSKDKLINSITETIINDGAKKILDFAEVSIGDSGRYKSYRGKVLRVLNDVVRKLQIDIKNHYVVEFESNMESLMVLGSGDNKSNGKGEG